MSTNGGGLIEREAGSRRDTGGRKDTGGRRDAPEATTVAAPKNTPTVRRQISYILENAKYLNRNARLTILNTVMARVEDYELELESDRDLKREREHDRAHGRDPEPKHERERERDPEPKHEREPFRSADIIKDISTGANKEVNIDLDKFSQISEAGLLWIYQFTQLQVEALNQPATTKTVTHTVTHTVRQQ